MKTKILLTGMAKQTRINIQISIKIIAAKIQTTSWPKLDNNTPFFVSFFCMLNCEILGKYTQNKNKTLFQHWQENTILGHFFAFYLVLLCLI